MMKTALTIAGSDCSGGAGIQADLKTMTANGVYGMSAITALTAQNTTGVSGILEVTPGFLAMQLDSVFTDIVPDAVKIGMVSSAALIGVIAQKLKQYDAKNIVLDPVMVATSGARLIGEDAISSLTAQLMPLAMLVTPNIPEAEMLTGTEIRTPSDMERAAYPAHTAVRCCSRAVTVSVTQMIISARIHSDSGFSGNALTTRIRTGQAVRCPLRLRQILPRAIQ